MAEQMAAAAVSMPDQTQQGGIPWVEAEGVAVPKVFEDNLRRPFKEHIDCIRAMDMRDDDVILCAFAKSGTHWLWEVGSMLLAGNAEYDKRTKEHVMMETTDVEKMQALPSPRLLNTHLPVSILPNQIKASKKVKVIHVIRNPKDVLVSFFFHIVQTNRDMTVDKMVEKFLFGKFTSGNYFDYLKGMDSFIKNNPDVPVFNMSFEDMKEDPKGMVRKLAKFLQVEASEELCDSIADACSFHNMKKADKTLKDAPRKFKNRIEMYRKGEVGDWKNHLTVAVSERIDKAMESLQGCDFRFRYTL